MPPTTLQGDIMPKKKTTLHEKMAGSEMTFRDGEMTVKVHPLGNILTYFLLDKCSTTDENGNYKHNNFTHMLLTVAYGIDEAIIKGKKLPMETEKIMGKAVSKLRMSEIDRFSKEELAEIAEKIFEISNLSDDEVKN